MRRIILEVDDDFDAEPNEIAEALAFAQMGFGDGRVYEEPEELANPVLGKVSPWIEIDGYCAARIRAGGNPDNVADRVAFIEKTPRVRIRAYPPSHEASHWDGMNWCEGNDFKGNDAKDPVARAWCDRMLIALGYELED